MRLLKVRSGNPVMVRMASSSTIRTSTTTPTTTPWLTTTPDMTEKEKVFIESQVRCIRRPKTLLHHRPEIRRLSALDPQNGGRPFVDLTDDAVFRKVFPPEVKSKEAFYTCLQVAKESGFPDLELDPQSTKWKDFMRNFR